jgi:hypothetical protein
MLTVLIPWRPQPSRLSAFDAVAAWYHENFVDVTIRTVDSDDELFNLAQCRNLAIDSVTDDDEVVVINDADTIPERTPLLAAIEAASRSGLVHLPYTEYRWLGPVGTEQLQSGTALEECAFDLVISACSGVYVTTPRTWRNHGGQDERFRGWGFEDAAWYVAHETLLGAEPQRAPGRVYALHHDAQGREGPQYDANAALMGDYREAASDPDAMRDLVMASNARRGPGR